MNKKLSHKKKFEERYKNYERIENCIDKKNENIDKCK